MRRVCLASILVLAFFLRFYQLGVNPPSLDWDEASLGYNAYSLLKTGKDEYGELWPINLTSFGDFKPAVYVYLAVPPIVLFGLNDFAVRLPSALLGTLTVLVAYFLIHELSFSGTYTSGESWLLKLSWLSLPSPRWLSASLESISLLTTFFLAISPWHIQFSRVAFEANIGLFWLILAVWFYLLGLKKPIFLLLSSIAFSLSLYSYHASRVFVPIFLLGIAWYCRQLLKRHKRWVLVASFIFVVSFLPISNFLVDSGRVARFQAVGQFRPDLALEPEIKRQEIDRARSDWLGVLLHNRRVSYLKSVISSYLDHFGPSFLFLEGDEYVRHNPQGMGLLYIWSLPFILLGLLTISQMKGLPRFVVFLWFFLAPVASSLTKGTPHAVRALLFIPTYQLFASVGIATFVQFFQTFTSGVAGLSKAKAITPPRWLHWSIYRRTVVMIVILGFILNIFYYLNLYFIHTPIETSQAWQYGYKQLIDEVERREGQFSRVLVTSAYDQPYIYFLFYLPVNPLWYQKNWQGKISREFRSFGKYEFRPISWQKDSKLSNVLLAVSPQEVGNIPQNEINPLRTIHFLDGSVAFYIIKL